MKLQISLAGLPLDQDFLSGAIALNVLAPNRFGGAIGGSIVV